VVHGGLFHNTDVTLEELNAIDRTRFTLEDLPENGELPEPLSRENPTEFFKQLTRDALWSDPVDLDGLHESVRGAGVAFGPDVAKAFLEKHNFKLVIRSHECIRSGYDEPYQSEIPENDKLAPFLCTIFSASDYGGSGNSAAYLEFHLAEEKLFHAAEGDYKRLSREQRSMSRDSISADFEPPIMNNNNKPSSSLLAAAISHSSNPNSSKRSSSRLDPSNPTSMKDYPFNNNYNETTVHDDNQSDFKWIDCSRLYYQVHYFYAQPLSLDPNGDGMERDSYSGGDLFDYVNNSDNIMEGGETDRMTIHPVKGDKTDHSHVKGSFGSTASSSSAATITSLPPLAPPHVAGHHDHPSPLPTPPTLTIQVPPNNNNKEQQPPSIVSPTSSHSNHAIATSHKPSGRVSFAGTTLIIDDLDTKERHLINDIDPTKELLSDARSILVSSSLTLDELIFTRKQLLLEGFEKLDFDGKGLILLKDWIHIMSEILNLSISWRKIGKYILREEDRVPIEGGQFSTQNSLPPAPTPPATPLPSGRIDSGSSSPMKGNKKSFDKLSALQRNPSAGKGGGGGPGGGNHSANQDASLETIQVKYRMFLDRYEDEETKRKRKEQEEFTLAILRRYQSSTTNTIVTTPSAENNNEPNEANLEGPNAVALLAASESVSGGSGKENNSGPSSNKQGGDGVVAAAVSSSGNSSRKKDTATEEQEKKKPDPIPPAININSNQLVSLTDYNKYYAPHLEKPEEKQNQPQPPSLSPQEEDPYLLFTHYFGYQVPEYVVASIYTNYKQLENAFQYLDDNNDGFFDLQDFIRAADMLQINEILSTEIINYPMIKNIKFSPELIMKLVDINQQNCIDMNLFYEIFRLSILNKLYDRDALSKPLLARETSYSMELHRLTHHNSGNLSGSMTPNSLSSSTSFSSHLHPQQHSALSSLELKKGVEISVDNELVSSSEVVDHVGLSVDI
jgi:diadenosine tetraphosphatase ApaH/serine/threonine PP2A family protein phosphatase